MKSQAWLSSQAISNVLSAAFGDKMLPYDELFPAEVDEPDEDPELLYEKCRLHGLPTPRKE